MNNTNLSQALAIVTTALTEDAEYRESWKANIAMSFKDEAVSQNLSENPSLTKIHEIANSGAERFLTMLCSLND